MTIEEVMKRYSRIVAHIICHSLGYATPSCAARILKDAKEGKENWREWIFSIYDRNPRKPVEITIKTRHTHHGYMADYCLPRQLVHRAIEEGKEPIFAGWF